MDTIISSTCLHSGRCPAHISDTIDRANNGRTKRIASANPANQQRGKNMNCHICNKIDCQKHQPYMHVHTRHTFTVTMDVYDPDVANDATLLYAVECGHDIVVKHCAVTTLHTGSYAKTIQ